MKARLRAAAVLQRLRQFPGAVLKGLRLTVVAGYKGARRTVVTTYNLAVSIIQAGVSFGRYLWRSLVAGIKSKRMRLIVVAAVFVGWLSYLGYAALTKNRGPVISRAQAAAALVAVVAEVEAGEDGKPRKKVKVIETLTKNGPDKGAEIEVENLPAATARSGFTGRGEYLLLLSGPPIIVVGQQRSPGNDVAGVGPPLVYRWTDDVRRQFEAMPKRSEPPGP